MQGGAYDPLADPLDAVSRESERDLAKRMDWARARQQNADTRLNVGQDLLGHWRRVERHAAVNLKKQRAALVAAQTALPLAQERAADAVLAAQRAAADPLPAMPAATRASPTTRRAAAFSEEHITELALGMAGLMLLGVCWDGRRRVTTRLVLSAGVVVFLAVAVYGHDRPDTSASAPAPVSRSATAAPSARTVALANRPSLRSVANERAQQVTNAQEALDSAEAGTQTAVADEQAAHKRSKLWKTRVTWRERVVSRYRQRLLKMQRCDVRTDPMSCLLV